MSLPIYLDFILRQVVVPFYDWLTSKKNEYLKVTQEDPVSTTVAFAEEVFQAMLNETSMSLYSTKLFHEH